MDETRLRSLFSQHAAAMHAYINPRSMAIIRFANGSPTSIGTGTTIQINDRLFLATAAHVVADCPPSNLMILPFRHSEHHRVAILDVGMREEHDVAWVEIDPHSLPPASWPCGSLDDMQVGVAHIDDMMAMYGYPGDLLTSFPIGSRRIVPLCLVGGTIDVLQWPADWPPVYGRSAPVVLAPSKDIIIDYMPAGPMEDDPLRRLMPEPHGMSGGGVWNVRTKVPSVWAPSRSRLVGIAVEYDAANRLVRATQIQHWLGAVAGDHPDLSGPIERLLSA